VTVWSDQQVEHEVGSPAIHSSGCCVLPEQRRLCWGRIKSRLHLVFGACDVKLIIVALLLASAIGVVLFTDNSANPHVRANSSGPPPGFTRAPGELDCSDCHTTPPASSGTISLSVPSTYTPGQAYIITVTHTTTDQTRVRWGFELTALDASDQKAGTLAPLDAFTQVRNNEGPFPSRQYIEHNTDGTFFGQHNGASWTFRWTAPAQNVGVVTFYVAGNQANGDANSSGDNIYFTFAASQPAAPASDFNVTIAPATRTVAPGGATTYDITITPTGGFTGNVPLQLNSVLPSGAGASFNPNTITITDANPKTATLTITTSSSTPPDTYEVRVLAIGNDMPKYASSSLVVTNLPPELRLEQNGPDPNQAAALDSLLLIRDPFHVQSVASWWNLGADPNTRVIVFAANVSLNSGENSSAVTIDLTDGAGHMFNDIAAEDVRPVANSDLTQIKFRLPNNLALGTCLVKIKLHGLVSNVGTFRIIQ